MRIPFPVELPAVLCGAAERSSKAAAAARRGEQHFKSTLPLSRCAGYGPGRAACLCRDGSTTTPEERIYFGGALRGPPARFTAAQKPRAAFPEWRERESRKETLSAGPTCGHAKLSVSPDTPGSHGKTRSTRGRGHTANDDEHEGAACRHKNQLD